MRRYILGLLAAVCIALMHAVPANATVNSQTNRTQVLGNGSQTQFTFNFIGVAAAYISVIYTDASGNQTVLQQGSGSTQYQITLNAPVQGAIWGVGGTVTYNPSGTPIPNGSTLTIYRTLPLTQAISLSNLNSVATLGKGAETGLDTGVMQGQQISEQSTRAIVANITNSAPPLPLPPAAQLANKGLCGDSTGNNIIGCAIPSSGVISTAMQPVVSAATLAAGRTAFGLGSLAIENIGSGLQDDGANNARVNVNAVTQDATNQSVGAAFNNTRRAVTGPITYTLARLNTLWNGFGLCGSITGGSLTLAVDPNDTIKGLSSGQPLGIPANSTFCLTGDGATFGTWYVSWSPLTLPLVAPAAGGSVKGLSLVNNTGTPNTKMDYSMAEVVMLNSTGGAFRATNLTGTVDLTTGTVSSTLNGMDGEIIPANGDLFWWAVSNGATSGVIGSTSSTAPTFPTGYTFKKYLGAFKTASSILKRIRQSNSRSQYTVVNGSNTPNLPVAISGSSGNPTTGPSFTAVAVTSYVPATASRIQGILFAFAASGGVANANIIAAPNSNYGVASSITNPPPAILRPGVNANTNGASVDFDWVLEGALQYASDQSNAGIAILGWDDPNV